MTDDLPECEISWCRTAARWAICDIEGLDPLNPVVRWHTCEQHVGQLLKRGSWTSDHVRIYDLSEPVGAA